MGVGPSTKEITLHHFRDPLLDIISSDKDINLIWIIVVRTPQFNEDKNFVGKTADWFGNSHVDYANTIEKTGKEVYQ